MRNASLPLGIDIGSSRIRIARAERSASGPVVSAVAVRDINATPEGDDGASYVALLIEDMLKELGTRERRCVAAIAEPNAWMRIMRCPKMTTLERDRWARYEAQRLAPFSLEDAVIRLYALRASDMWALGAAKASSIRFRVNALRAAKLRPVCVDHEAFALFRALPGYDAVLDIGVGRTLLHSSVEEGTVTLHTACGGGDITQGIARDLAIDSATAEKRKRILGTAGAGEHVRSAVATDVGNLIREARSRIARPLARIAAVGNGARLPGLCADIAAKSEATVDIPMSEALRGVQSPPDVVRAAVCDWTLAAGLAMWSAQ